MLTIYKREMASYFRSPVAYCIMGFFMAIVGLMFWINNILNASAQFSQTLSSIGVFLTFLVPIITMKLLSDEKKNGTEVLLRTCPVPMWKIVTGKYLASVTLFLIMTLLTFIFPVLIAFLAEEGAVLGTAQDMGSYLLIGSILLSNQPVCLLLYGKSGGGGGSGNRYLDHFLFSAVDRRVSGNGVRRRAAMDCSACKISGLHGRLF